MKIFLVKYIALISLVMAILNCEDDEKNENSNLYQMIAYESLSEDEKASISENWKEGEVIEGILKKDECEYEFQAQSMGRLCFFPAYNEVELTENQKLVAVIFHTIHDSLLGPIIIIIDPTTQLPIGTVGRL